MNAEIEPSELWRIAEAVADAARLETLRHFRSPGLQTESKQDDFDPVTIADRAAEAAMRRVIADQRPDDGILGEEEEAVAGTSGLTWVLDPIDGTRGYISGTPTWGVLVAVSDAHGPRLGLIDQPYIGERFMGGAGRAEVTGPLGTRPLSVRKTTALSEATLFTTFPEVGSEAEGAAFRRVACRAKLVRYGCDCYAYALLAAGQIDLVIEAAGGILTNWEGGAAHDGGRALAAATPELHQAALELLAG